MTILVTAEQFLEKKCIYVFNDIIFGHLFVLISYLNEG